MASDDDHVGGPFLGCVHDLRGGLARYEFFEPEHLDRALARFEARGRR
jgi:hypothetical protein